MHIFLQGPRNIGKSTVIRKTLAILTSQKPLAIGGFFTWNCGEAGKAVYLQSAKNGGEGEVYRIASQDKEKGGLLCDIEVFERDGVRLLIESKDADLVIMDELGFLESDASNFRQAVLDLIAGDIPVYGVLRLGDVPWHAEIKRNPRIALYDVNEENRDALPKKLADALNSCFIEPS